MRFAPHLIRIKAIPGKAIQTALTLGQLPWPPLAQLSVRLGTRKLALQVFLLPALQLSLLTREQPPKQREWQVSAAQARRLDFANRPTESRVQLHSAPTFPVDRSTRAIRA